MSQIFKLPELGDAGMSGTVVSMSVAKGDSISCGETLLEIETDKVVLEVPAEVSGVVDNFLIEVGQPVQQGDEFVSITPSEEEQAEPEDVAVPIPTENISDVTTNSISDKPEKKPVELSRSNTTNTGSQKIVSAGPASRRLARELGVDLTKVKGTGFRGRIDKTAVKEYARHALSQPSQHSIGYPQEALPNMSAYGPIRRQAMTGIQKATSRNMSQSAARIPHAWLQRKIDITALEHGRKKYRKRLKEEGIELTLTTLLCKVIAQTAAQHPLFNSCLDEQTEELIFREQINVGVAVDTPRGLVVPVINNVATQSVKDIARKLSTLSVKARDSKLKTADIKGGSITLSNLGGLAAEGVFPIINWPEVAIVGVGAAQWLPHFANENTHNPELRLMMPLSLAFDHRVINGADAAKFLQTFSELCNDSFLMMLS